MIKGWILPFVYKSYSSDIKISYQFAFTFFVALDMWSLTLQFCSFQASSLKEVLPLAKSFFIVALFCFILLYFAYFAYFGLQRNWKLNYLKKKKQGLSFAEKQNCKQFALKSHPLMITLYLLLLFLFLFKLFNSFGFFAFFYHYYILYFCVKSHFCFTQI